MANNLGNGIFSLQEFYNRGVIKMAPDVLVYVGGSLTTQVIAPVSGKDNTLSFNDGISTVSIQNNVDPPGTSTATIEIVTPIYGENSKYWVEFPTKYEKGKPGGNFVRAPLFVQMMEVKIFFKGRFMVDGKPRYYPAFWGFITNVEENYSGGMYKIILSCADILHWWAYSSVNIHPIPESNIMAGGALTLTAFSTVFRRMNPFQILYTLTTNMGMHEFITVSWAGQKTPLGQIYPRELFKKVTAGIMAYWQQRFQNVGNLLKMYGINGKRVDRRGLQLRQPEIYVPKKNNSDTGVPYQDRSLYSLDRDFIEKFEIFADYEKMGTWENAEFMTKLQIATEIKTKCDFEFFQDVDGNFVFKPPFYNLNVKGIMPYTVLPTDIISYSLSADTEGLITVLTVNTPMYKNLRLTTSCLGVGFHMDIDLVKRFGIRHQEMTVEYVTNQKYAKTLALGQMTMINAKVTTGSVTIPGRPELRLGYPIYMEHRDSFHYIKSINHAFDYGGSFTTTLSLETERKKVWYEDKDKKWKVYIDKVYRYTGKDNEEQEEREKESLEQIRPKVGVRAEEEKEDKPQPIFAVTKVEKTRQNIWKQTESLQSMKQGKYFIDDRMNTGIHLRKNPKGGAKEMSITETSVPYTDEDGYYLIGAFPYGRALNAVCIVSDSSDLPYLKDVYLTTMARPLYQYESESMSTLFWKDKEGAVPGYLNLEDRGVPRILGELRDVKLEEIWDTNTDDKKKKSQKMKAPTKEVAKEITNFDPMEGSPKEPVNEKLSSSDPDWMVRYPQ